MVSMGLINKQALYPEASNHPSGQVGIYLTNWNKIGYAKKFILCTPKSGLSSASDFVSYSDIN